MKLHTKELVGLLRSFLLVGGIVAAGSSFAETTVYYIPTAEPYLWTDACWFLDSAGTNPLGSLPTADHKPYLSFSGLANKTLTIPSNTDVSVDTIEMRTAKSTIEVSGGSTLTLGHTTTLGKANNTTLRILPGATVTASSYFNLCDSTRSNVRLVIEEGGFANFQKQPVTLGNNSSGSAYVDNYGDVYFNSHTYLAQYALKSDGGKSTAKACFNNYGTLRTRSSGSQVMVVGAGAGTTAYLTNHVNGVANIDMFLSVGGGTNGTGYVVNNGTMKLTRNLSIGGDSVSSSRDNITEGLGATGTLRNNADLTTVAVNLGGHKYGNGTLDNAGTLSIGGNLTLADRQGTTGRFFARAGSSTTMSGDCTVSYYGNATFTAEGDARIVGSKSGLQIANDKDNSIGRVVLSGMSSWTNTGTIEMGLASSQADLELSDSAKIENTGAIYIGRGATKAVSETQHARVTLCGRSMIAGISGSVYLATNNYGRADLEIADESVLEFTDMQASRAINVGSSHSGTLATLRLRGGLIRMPSTNATVRVGYANYTAARCNGFLQGWGRIVRHHQDTENSYANGISLVMPCGAIVADGEGVARDLDLSAVRRINTAETPGENLSGTNGWYAVNKGRLYYPCRYAGYVNLGTYYGDVDVPKFVNGVNFKFSGTEEQGCLHGQLYATDREDIPDGLPADSLADGVKRLGVWRAALRDSYKSENFETSQATTFASARARVRYDNYALEALRAEDGTFREDQRISLYQYRDGRWQKRASLGVAAATEAGHVITGTLYPTEDDWNVGFFAVVAEPASGSLLLIR